MKNLRVLVFGKKLTSYQRALVQKEFKNMEKRIELPEKVVKNNRNTLVCG